MTNLTLLFACLLIGIILRRVKGFPQEAHLVLNSFIIYVCLPALTLLYTTEIHFQKNQFLPVLMPYILYVFSFIFFSIISPIFQFDKATTGALIITAGISSISFVGFPIFELLYGKEGLQMGILMSQSGSFVVCGTMGIMTASYFSDSEPSFKKMAINIVNFPPFVAFCIAVLLNLSGFHFSILVNEILQKIGSPFSILALVSVGLQINFSWKDFTQKPFLFGLFFKLFLAPLIIFLLYVILLHQNTWLGQMCVIGAGLGSMNTATIIAINYRLNPPLATKMVGIGIPLSLITLVFWYFLLGFIA